MASAKTPWDITNVTVVQDSAALIVVSNLMSASPGLAKIMELVLTRSMHMNAHVPLDSMVRYIKSSYFEEDF